ncbi:hypothetical protein GKC30_09220 [Pseudodesulfovibrio sp. F-1]|uniref:Acylneuraminate cytidylyltransferase family protein n=1 Tax=Pseudodesulfovibrio alkaliphilus TaxID=2661613 RepID=A0A7K1KP06_9BACT|nr:hypothetical protein [Pseudodesulfovibrio alkaliphilus]
MSDSIPRVLAVIPARGGSKRLPRKNIRMLAGHPMLAYTIQAAQQATTVTDFLVSTEDKEIQRVAKEYGAPTPFLRPAEIAGDAVRNIDVMLHALDFMEKERGWQYDIILLMQPTSPVRDPNHLDEAVRLLATSELDTIASVKGPFKKRDPILKAIRDGELVTYCSEAGEREPFYVYNAALYGMKRDYFVSARKHVSERQIPLVMDQLHSVDVDTAEDFMVAEAYINHLKKNDFTVK